MLVEERIQAFFALRDRWAGVHNLSGPRALQDPETIDLLDARAVCSVLVPALPLVDVGAGSGVPGLLVACLEPERTIWVVEPLAKRSAFLRTAAHELGLVRVRVVRERWPITLREPVQVVSRAVVSPEDWPVLAAGGGPLVASILRMLAARRPVWPLADFASGSALDYRVGESDRRIERWDRITAPPPS